LQDVNVNNSIEFINVVATSDLEGLLTSDSENELHSVDDYPCGNINTNANEFPVAEFFIKSVVHRMVISINHILMLYHCCGWVFNLNSVFI